jgi:hypothetical protein
MQVTEFFLIRRVLPAITTRFVLAWSISRKYKLNVAPGTSNFLDLSLFVVRPLFTVLAASFSGFTLYFLMKSDLKKDHPDNC